MWSLLASRAVQPARVCVLIAIAGSLSAQRPDAATTATPSSWLQLGNGTSNAGVVPGTLDVRWHFKAQRPVRGLAVADGIVVIGTESADADAAADKFSPDQRGFVTALDVKTGKPLWTHDVPDWVHGDPAIYKGRVYVNYGSWPLIKPGGVVAFDLHTGDTLWTMRTAVGNMTAPLVDTATQTLIVAGGEAIIYELSLLDGKPTHQFGLRAPAPMSSPRLSNGAVYVGGTETLTSYSLDKKTLNWRSRAPSTFGLGNIPVALTESVVYTSGLTFIGFWNAFRAIPFRQFLSMTREAYASHPLDTYDTWFQQLWLLAIDRRDGHLLWRKPLGVGLDVPRNSAGTPSVSGNRVIITSPHSKSVHAFDAVSGRELWARKLPAMHKGAVTIIGDDALLGDRKAVLTVYNANDGKPLGSCTASGPFTVLAPILVGKTLFTATKDGWVSATPYDTVRRRALSPGAKACF